VVDLFGLPAATCLDHLIHLIPDGEQTSNLIDKAFTALSMSFHIPTCGCRQGFQQGLLLIIAYIAATLIKMWSQQALLRRSFIRASSLRTRFPGVISTLNLDDDTCETGDDIGRVHTHRFLTERRCTSIQQRRTFVSKQDDDEGSRKKNSEKKINVGDLLRRAERGELGYNEKIPRSIGKHPHVQLERPEKRSSGRLVTRERDYEDLGFTEDDFPFEDDGFIEEDEDFLDGEDHLFGKTKANDLIKSTDDPESVYEKLLKKHTDGEVGKPAGLALVGADDSFAIQLADEYERLVMQMSDYSYGEYDHEKVSDERALHSTDKGSSGSDVGLRSSVTYGSDVYDDEDPNMYYNKSLLNDEKYFWSEEEHESLLEDDKETLEKAMGVDKKNPMKIPFDPEKMIFEKPEFASEMEEALSVSAEVDAADYGDGGKGEDVNTGDNDDPDEAPMLTGRRKVLAQKMNGRVADLSGGHEEVDTRDMFGKIGGDDPDKFYFWEQDSVFGIVNRDIDEYPDKVTEEDLGPDEVAPLAIHGPDLDDFLEAAMEHPTRYMTVESDINLHPQSKREPKPIIPRNRANPPVEFVQKYKRFLYVTGLPPLEVDGAPFDKDNWSHVNQMQTSVAELIGDCIDIERISPANDHSAFVGCYTPNELAHILKMGPAQSTLYRQPVVRRKLKPEEECDFSKVSPKTTIIIDKISKGKTPADLMEMVPRVNSKHDVHFLSGSKVLIRFNSVSDMKEAVAVISAPLPSVRETLMNPDEDCRFYQESPDTTIVLDNIPAGVESMDAILAACHPVVVKAHRLSLTKALLRVNPGAFELEEFSHGIMAAKSVVLDAMMEFSKSAALGAYPISFFRARRELLHSGFDGHYKFNEFRKMGPQLIVDMDMPSRPFYISHAGCVILRNLDPSVTKKDITQAVQAFCSRRRDVEGSVELVTSANGIPTGRAFVGFETPDEAEAVLAATKGLMKIGHTNCSLRLLRDRIVPGVKPVKIDKRPERQVEELLDDLNNWEKYVAEEDIQFLVDRGINKLAIDEALRGIRRYNPTFGSLDSGIRAEALKPEKMSGDIYKEIVQLYIEQLKECISTPENVGAPYQAIHFRDEPLDLTQFELEKQRQRNINTKRADQKL
jgi:hypothetical protein